MVLVGGEAGIGKSALVDRFCGGLGRDARVLVGTCDALSTPRPLGPLFDMSDALGDPFAQALGSDSRDGIFDALLRELRASPPPVVVIEDAHWADDATFDLLRFLGRRIGSTRALAIVTYRDDEVRSRHPLRAVLGDLATSASVIRLGVPALSRAAVAELARGFDVDASELHRTTGGNPFFVTEVLAAGGSVMPTTVEDAVNARASRLPDGARGALDLASVIGSEVDPEILTALGATPSDIEAMLDSGILRAAGPRIAFRHELVRDAVYGGLSVPRRRELHRRVLAWLSHSDVARDDPAVLAHHAAEAGDGKAVLRFAPVAAARAAALRAHREARAQYARLIPYLSGLADERRAELLDAYSTECTIGDAFAEGASARRQAIDIWRRLGRPTRVGLGLSLLAQAELGLGRDADAEASNDEAIRVLEPLAPSLELARAYWYGAVICASAGDTAGVVEYGTRAIELCRTLDELPMMANAHNVIGGALLAVGDEEGRAHLARSLALGRELDTPELIADAHVLSGTAAIAAHRFDDAVRELRAAAAIAVERDHDNIRHDAMAKLALALLYLGHLNEAADAAMAVAARPLVAAYSRMTALLALGRLRARRGDPGAMEVLDEALELAQRSGSPGKALPIRLARAEAAVLSGDTHRALEEAEAARACLPDHRVPWHVGELAYWLASIGKPDEAPTAAAEPYALQSSGAAAAAAAAWDALGCPYEAARARSDADDPAMVRQALDALNELGARPAAAMTACRLRELGVRGIPRGPRPSTLDHPAQLTRRESQVLALLAQGLRNQEISARHAVSARTVDHQVSSILAKLGVRSRTEAVAEAHRLGLLDEDRQRETAS